MALVPLLLFWCFSRFCKFYLLSLRLQHVPFPFPPPKPSHIHLALFQICGRCPLIVRSSLDSRIPLKFILTQVLGAVSSVLVYFSVVTATNVEVFILVLV